MQLSTAALFEAGGIRCKRVSQDASSGELVLSPARAVFVTMSTVEAARNILAGRGGSQKEAGTQDFALGDIVVTWIDAQGRPGGAIASSGQDAGVVLEAEGGERHIPFTGDHILTARAHLIDRMNAGHSLTIDEARVLVSIDELLQIVREHPDAKRFSDMLHGFAFRTSIAAKGIPIDIQVSDAEIGRFFVAWKLRSKISSLSHGHQDSISSCTAHDKLLADLCSTPGHEAEFRENQMDCQFAALLRDSLSMLSSARGEDLGSTELGAKETDKLHGALKRFRMTEKWAMDILENVASAAVEVMAPSGQVTAGPAAMLAQYRGRDLLLLTFDVGPGAPVGCVISWPTQTRKLVVEKHGSILVQASSLDIPSQAEISRLACVLDDLRLEHSIEFPGRN